MKTIEQLLQLSKNPFYKFTPDEQMVLNDFLSQKQDTGSQTLPKKDLKKSSKRTPVIVRNVVKKADTYPPEEQETPQNTFSAKKR